MNPDPFEQQLQRRPLPQLPPEWRAEILGAATAAREDQERAETPARGISWKHVRWGVLAAVWVTILTLGQMDPDDTRRPSSSTLAYEDVVRAVQERNRLMTEVRANEPGTGTPITPPAVRQRSGRYRPRENSTLQYA